MWGTTASLVVMLGFIIYGTIIMEKKMDQMTRQNLEITRQQSEEEKKRVEEASKTLVKKIAFEQSVNCLANNIYYEAATEPYEGKVAVGQVTINRTHDIDRPRTICGVVYEPFQFTWTRHKLKEVNEHLYQEAVAIAKRILTKKERSAIIGKDVTYYHAVWVHPEWADEHEIAAQIGNHIFYRREKIKINNEES